MGEKMGVLVKKVEFKGENWWNWRNGSTLWFNGGVKMDGIDEKGSEWRSRGGWSIYICVVRWIAMWHFFTHIGCQIGE